MDETSPSVHGNFTVDTDYNYYSTTIKADKEDEFRDLTAICSAVGVVIILGIVIVCLIMRCRKKQIYKGVNCQKDDAFNVVGTKYVYHKNSDIMESGRESEMVALEYSLQTDISCVDPLSDITRNQRVVLYSLFLCCNDCCEISMNEKITMGDIDISKTMEELECMGLLEYDKYRNRLFISYDIQYRLIICYMENCVLSDIDKDFFIMVASEFSIRMYIEVYILNKDDFKSPKETTPITMMRILLQAKSGALKQLYFALKDAEGILHPGYLQRFTLDKLRNFVLVWFRVKGINDPIKWADDCTNERIKNVYCASLISQVTNTETCCPLSSPLKSSIYCTILMAENYEVCKDDLDEKVQIVQKVFPVLYHSAFPTFSDTIKEMKEVDKTITVDKNVIRFASENVRHQAMGDFVMVCLKTNEDYMRYFQLSSVNSLLDYVRPWCYRKFARCIFLPDEMENAFITRLGLDAIRHVMVEKQIDNYGIDNIRKQVMSNVNVPGEVFDWDYKSRFMYVENAKKGTQTIHRARAMIVGCAGAGKTTLLKRLQNKDLTELKSIRSTVGLEVHENIFEVLEDQGSIAALREEKNNDGKALLSILDFGGQCAYYACHQVYLSRRAFYILVIDMSKSFKEKVDKKLCDQEGTMFGDWTYGEYLLFWMKSIHIYCDEVSPIILVGTHLDKTSGQTPNTFFNSVLEYLRFDKNLKAHLDRKRCFILGFQIKDGQILNDLSDLKNCIVSIAKEDRWKESIPTDWALSEVTLNILREQNKHIVSKADFQEECFHNITEKYAQIPGILRLFHEIGIILNFNENDLSEIIIVDIQWFVDAFKNIITDCNHAMDIADNNDEWRNFYQNGLLTDKLLKGIWLQKSFMEGYLKKDILQYMQRLGLLVAGDDEHYIPCMNKRTFDASHEEKFRRYQNKTSVLVLRFPFLPYFIFFRLIVACMTRTDKKLRILNDQGLCLFKNVVCLDFKQHTAVLAVNHTSIQLQIFEPSNVVKKKVALEAREIIERELNELTKTFHKELVYTAGYQCSMNEVFREYDECFVEETAIYMKGKITCPRHEVLHHHILDESDLSGYWKQDSKIKTSASAMHGDYFIVSYEEGLRKFHFKTFEKLTKVGRDAMQVYFDTVFPLQKLINMSSRKGKVKKEFRLNDDQCARLFPAAKHYPSSESFDVTMMYQMLRNCTPSLAPPAKGWGKTPDTDDTSETDDVERVRIYRNQVVHEPDATSKLDKKDLEEKGRDLTQAILRLSCGALKLEMMNALRNT